MPDQPRTDNNADNLSDSSDRFLPPALPLVLDSEDTEQDEEDLRQDFFQGLSGRRQKAAFVLLIIWGVMIGLHHLSWGVWVVWLLTFVLLGKNLQLILAQPAPPPEPLTDSELDGELDGELADAPLVSLLIAAKNEEKVIPSLVEQLIGLDYPIAKYEVWIIDDRSSDRTPEILDQLALKYSQLNVIHRLPGAGGGKSGALNEVLPLTQGQIIGVFDADAKIPADLLRSVLPLFAPAQIGAVQVRKSIVNAPTNFWTQGQSLEMALDAYIQQQRIAIGGMAELRGNGQFVRRQALEHCGGWNEQTITDDLDLTFRLHLDHWDIDALFHPAVGEEGVTTAIALWHQRNRWAEGGYQRYLDYWKYFVNIPLKRSKRLDLITFLLIQYLLPTAAIPDLILAAIYHHLPLLTPLTGAILTLSVVGIVNGSHQTLAEPQKSGHEPFLALVRPIKGLTYLMHWFVIIPSVTARISVQPKRLKWVKTVHEGAEIKSQDFEKG
jgi:1,2-diacylglycerol 3-beta-glucosyltransferase